MWLSFTAAAGCDWSALKPGHWCEVPDSDIAAIKPSPEPPGALGQRAVTRAWCGGAFDPDRDLYILWGGGHTDYAGNELYMFDVNTLRWRRTEPAADVAETGTSTYHDGTPRSVHTYGYLAYVASIGELCSIGLASDYPDSRIWNEIWCNDLDNQDGPLQGWHKVLDGWQGATYSSNADYDPVTGHVFYENKSSGWKVLYEWDPEAGTWTARSEAYGNGPHNVTASTIVNPAKRIVFGVGGGEQWYWDISRSGLLTSTINTDTAVGGALVRDAWMPGLTYDSKNQSIVAWVGNQNGAQRTSTFVYEFETNAWTECVAAGDNTSVPGVQQTNGTYDRWQYVPSKDAFILYNETTENVFLYRLPVACGGTQGDPPEVPAPPTGLTPG
jgi:hypothetical protein